MPARPSTCRRRTWQCCCHVARVGLSWRCMTPEPWKASISATDELWPAYRVQRLRSLEKSLIQLCILSVNCTVAIFFISVSCQTPLRKRTRRRAHSRQHRAYSIQQIDDNSETPTDLQSSTQSTAGLAQRWVNILAYNILLKGPWQILSDWDRSRFDKTWHIGVITAIIASGRCMPVATQLT